jgi:tetratricopeptide (TPR) repeat protein
LYFARTPAIIRQTARMAEPRRHDSPPAADAADRDSRAEMLLVQGLDRYFSGQFEDAIHIWTRVLFLDRTHARARAYIDRARSALAERQRRGEEMLQASRDLLAQGRPDAARDLLRAAVEARGDDDQASALLVHLERFERLHAPAWQTPARRRDARPVPGWVWRRRSRVLAVTVCAVAAGLLISFGLGGSSPSAWLGLPHGRAPLAPSAIQPPAVLTSAEVALVRARTLYSRGRLAEALHVLNRVSRESPLRASADAMKVEIQQLLLATGRQPGPPADALDEGDP